MQESGDEKRCEVRVRGRRGVRQCKIVRCMEVVGAIECMRNRVGVEKERDTLSL